jgi:hypothetical protein
MKKKDRSHSQKTGRAIQSNPPKARIKKTEQDHADKRRVV